MGTYKVVRATFGSITADLHAVSDDDVIQIVADLALDRDSGADATWEVLEVDRETWMAAMIANEEAALSWDRGW